MYFEEIMSEVKPAGHISLALESTPDISNVVQLNSVILYVFPSGQVERFIQFLPMMEYTRLKPATRLLTFLEQHGIDIKKCSV